MLDDEDVRTYIPQDEDLRNYTPKHSHWLVCPLSLLLCLVILFGTRLTFEPPPPPLVSEPKYASVSPKPNQTTRQMLVACIGDSITVVGSNWSMSYPSQLQRLLGDAYNVQNFGFSGMTMMKNGLCWDDHSDYAMNCSYWKTKKFAWALQSVPDVVTIMLGTNDAKHINFDTEPPNWGEAFCPGCPVQGHGNSFEQDYLDMIATFRTLPNSPRILIGIPPPYFPPFPWNFSSYVLNELFPGPDGIIRRIGRFANVDGIVDTWTALGGAKSTQRRALYGGHCASQVELCTTDGIHPNDAALAKIAHEFAVAIQKLPMPLNV